MSIKKLKCKVILSGYRLFLGLIITVFTFLEIGHAQDMPPKEYYLGNGLKLLIKEDHRAPVVTVQLWYKVGSSYEPEGITGISHILEHMMFDGTTKYGPGVFYKTLEYNGAEEKNAFTFSDYTVYFETIPADKLNIIFDLEADRMQGLLFNSLEKTKQTVIEEYKLGYDNPNRLTYDRFIEKAHEGDPYSIPVIGKIQDIQNINISEIKSWYKKWYIPNNVIMVVVGDVEPDEVFKLAEQYFGKILSVNIPKINQQKEICYLTNKERTVTIKAHAKAPLIIMGYNTPSLKTIDQKWKSYALSIISGILTNRLFNELILDNQIASDGGVYYDITSRLDSLLVLTGLPTQNHTVSELKIAVLEQIKKLQTTQVEKEELENTINQIITAKIYNQDSTWNQAYILGSIEAVGLSWRDYEEYLKNIRNITATQIQEVANEYLIIDRLTTAELQPILTN